MGRQMFLEADDDGNGLMDKPEFEALLSTNMMDSLFAKLDIHIKKEELLETWDMLDVSGEGVLTVDEFVDGLAYLQEETISTRHIVVIDYSIKRLNLNMGTRLKALKSKVSMWRKRNQCLLDTLRQQEQVHQQQNIALWLWQQWAMRSDPSSFPADLQILAGQQMGLGPPSVGASPGVTNDTSPTGVSPDRDGGSQSPSNQA